MLIKNMRNKKVDIKVSFFVPFAIFRRLVGVGEASFISLAAPFIDDVAPDSQVHSLL